MAKKQATPAVAAPAAPAPKFVLGAKAPKHRAGHNGDAWAALTPILPATGAEIAALDAVKRCGGTKQNGLLFVNYAVRRGWLAEQVAETQQS